MHDAQTRGTNETIGEVPNNQTKMRFNPTVQLL